MRCVDLVITDLGVLAVDRAGEGGFSIVECAPGVEEAQLREATGGAIVG